MPTVESYNQPQVRDQGTPNVRFRSQVAELPTASSDIAQSVTGTAAKVANTAATFFEQQKKKADDVRITEHKGQLAHAYNELLYNPENGAMHKRGKDALGIDQDVFEQFDKLSGEMEVGLSGDYQRSEFQKARLAYREDLSRQLNQHMATEGRKYDEQVTEGLVANERTAAAVSYLDEERVRKAIDRQSESIRSWGERNGTASELIDAKVRDATSKTHLAVLTRMTTNNQGPLAKEYFAKVREEMDPEDAQSIEKHIKHVSVLADAQLAAQDISRRNNNMSAALKDIDKIKDPEVQEKTKDLVRERFSLMEQGKKQYQDSIFEKAAKRLEQSQNILELQRDPVWLQMDANQRSALESRYDRIVKGVDRKTDDKKFVEFLFLSQGQLASMSQSDYEKNYRQYFSNSDQSKADSDITSAKKGDEKNQLFSPFSSYKDRLDDTLRARSIVDESNPKKSDKDAKLYSELALSIRTKVEQFEQIDLGGKRRATGDEIQKLIDDVLIKKVRVKGTGWFSDTEKQAAILTDEEKGKAYVPVKDIPAIEKADIEQAFVSRKKRPTQDQIQRAYAAVLMKDKKLLQAILAE